MKIRSTAKTPKQKASLPLQPTIHIHQDQKRYAVDENHIQSLVFAFFQFHSLPHNEVSIHFVTKAKICLMHDIHFNDPSLTDCMSFPMDAADEPGYKILGEVFVCPGVAFEYAREHNCSYNHEVDLYVVHGLLHLIGFDDINKEERKLMRLEEKRFLESFNQT